MIVVSDTSPLLHVASIGRLDLLSATFGRVVVPATVWSELMHPQARPHVRDAISAATAIERVSDPPPVELGLDPGETAAILLAEAMRADVLLMDERRGRAVAAQRSIPVIGTLGVLAAAKRLGAIDTAGPVVEALRADGFWLAQPLVDEFLRRLGER